MAAGLLARGSDSGGGRYDGLGGLYRAGPLLCAATMLCLASLAGLPPTSGFWAKALLLKASLGEGRLALSAALLASSLFGLLFVARVWIEAVWKEPPAEGSACLVERMAGVGGSALSRRACLRLWLPLAVCAGCSLGVGLFPDMLLAQVMVAAQGLVDPQAYMDAVLGARPSMPDSLLGMDQPHGQGAGR
jgi:multicomponent Na+:H+ antiporter subunit D